MSTTDQPAEPVQPEGQGGEGANAPYAEYLNRIPEEVREQVEPVFRDWDSNVTRRFQEASEQRRSWEPYEQLGVNQLSPEEVQWALQFRQAAVENPQAVKEWYDSYAQQHQLIDQQQPPQQQDEFGFADPSSQQLEQLLQQQLGPIQQQLQQITQWREQQEAQVREQQVEQAINDRMSELEREHGAAFDRAMVERFATKYATPGADPRQVVNQGWQDLQAFAARIEKTTLQPKVEAPPAPETGGSVNAAAEQPSFGSPGLREAAAAMVRASLHQ